MASAAEERWIDQYLETGDAAQSVRDQFECSAASVPSRASQLKRKHADTIDQRLRDSMRQLGPQMLTIIRDLALMADQPAVKLKAAQDVLSRGGFDPVKESRELTAKPTAEELTERLRMALAGIDPDILTELLADNQLTDLARSATQLVTVDTKTQGNA